jgi:hydrogenase expression/formation protein HypE
MQDHAQSPAPAVIGEVREDGPIRVTMESAIGATRILDLPSGEQLPRIC